MCCWSAVEALMHWSFCLFLLSIIVIKFCLLHTGCSAYYSVCAECRLQCVTYVWSWKSPWEQGRSYKESWPAEAELFCICVREVFWISAEWDGRWKTRCNPLPWWWNIVSSLIAFLIQPFLVVCSVLLMTEKNGNSLVLGQQPKTQLLLDYE